MTGCCRSRPLHLQARYLFTADLGSFGVACHLSDPRVSAVLPDRVTVFENVVTLESIVRIAATGRCREMRRLGPSVQASAVDGRRGGGAGLGGKNHGGCKDPEGAVGGVAGAASPAGSVWRGRAALGTRRSRPPAVGEEHVGADAARRSTVGTMASRPRWVGGAHVGRRGWQGLRMPAEWARGADQRPVATAGGSHATAADTAADVFRHADRPHPGAHRRPPS